MIGYDIALYGSESLDLWQKCYVYVANEDRYFFYARTITTLKGKPKGVVIYGEDGRLLCVFNVHSHEVEIVFSEKTIPDMPDSLRYAVSRRPTHAIVSDAWGSLKTVLKKAGYKPKPLLMPEGYYE